MTETVPVITITETTDKTETVPAMTVAETTDKTGMVPAMTVTEKTDMMGMAPAMKTVQMIRETIQTSILTIQIREIHPTIKM